MEAVRDSEENLKKTASFRNQQGSLFKYVKKVGPSIRSHVNSVKKQALGIQKGCANRCNGRGCKTCKMLIDTPFVTILDKKVKLTQGNCITSNNASRGGPLISISFTALLIGVSKTVKL